MFNYYTISENSYTQKNILYQMINLYDDRKGDILIYFTQKKILYQNMKLYDDKKGEIMI